MNASDLTLLERFVSHREEAAFVALVERHGPRVQGTCRRVLRNEHDVEEVFQATFLLLARKAAVVAWRESVGSWLCAVAHRLALSARADASRLGGVKPRSPPWRAAEAEGPAARTISSRGRTSRSRSKIGICVGSSTTNCSICPKSTVRRSSLCDLEGRTHQEAAEQLGWPSGSISRRLVQRGPSCGADWSTGE